MLAGPENAVLVIIDVQEKLFAVVNEQERLLKNIIKLVRVCKTLGIPIVLTEQYPKGIGKTIQPIVQELGPDYKPIEKTTFSCFGAPEFERRLMELGRKVLLLTGIELHICVYQTAVDALKRGYTPIVIYDATSSRLRPDYELCLHRLLAKGVDVATTDMIIFELVRDASHPKFREVLSIVKQ